MQTKTLGVLGGLGPLSGVYFCEMLICHTRAQRDQEHLNFLLSSYAQTPDRTDFILGRSEENPSDAMVAQVGNLIRGGAEVIAIPCNTAHYFYDRIAEASSVPVINIIRETVAFCRAQGVRTVGVLATEGTVSSGAYESVCREMGIGYVTCTPSEQALITDMIYNRIKKGQVPCREDFLSVASALSSRGCERLILGCTELSVINFDNKLSLHSGDIVDAMEALSEKCITLCGKQVKK
jgi:aspartate racemase